MRPVRAVVVAVVAIGTLATPAARSQSSVAQLRHDILTALGEADAGVVGAVVAVEGYGAVAEANGWIPLEPASVEKLFTGAAALVRLGTDRRLVTEVRRTGGVSGGVLHGDLVLAGGGNPLLSGYQLGELANAVKAAGINRVAGTLYADETRFDATRIAPGWRPEFMPGYVGPLSALSVDGNGYRRDPGFLASPATGTGERFLQALAGAGVGVDLGVVARPHPAPFAAVAAHHGHPYWEIVRHLLKESDNFSAELVLKDLGATTNHGGTTAGGVAGVRDVLAALGVPDPGRLVDGSGLSDLDRVSAWSTAILLAAMDRTPHRQRFQSFLPTACGDGTFRDRLCGTPAAGRVHAKTGTKRGLVSLAGYATTASGRRVWFAFLVTEARSLATARAAIDRALVAIVRFSG